MTTVNNIGVIHWDYRKLGEAFVKVQTIPTPSFLLALNKCIDETKIKNTDNECDPPGENILPLH